MTETLQRIPIRSHWPMIWTIHYRRYFAEIPTPASLKGIGLGNDTLSLPIDERGHVKIGP